jgi:hypothetical protein
MNSSSLSGLVDEGALRRRRYNLIRPVQTTFRNVPPSDAVAARVQEEAQKLDEFYRRITSCRVIVEIPHRHHALGEQFHIRNELGAPGVRSSYGTS